MSTAKKAAKQAASSNWLALQRKLKPAGEAPPRKRRKVQQDESVSVNSETSIPLNKISSFPRGHDTLKASTVSIHESGVRENIVEGDDSVQQLKKMVLGHFDYTDAQKQPGKYLAVDCEMVGVGIEGKESSLARVSLVNYHGAVIMDEFVRQREHVVDYRTEYSGIRPSDMIKAKPFTEVQKQVADLLKDRILVGHAVHNDLKALLLSHPGPQTRDTQHLAGKHKLTKSRKPALRNLTQQELGLAIQTGEHSSVVDARATMAIYRLHKKLWEKGLPQLVHPDKKRKRSAQDAEEAEDDGDEGANVAEKSAKKSRATRPQGFPGGGRKGVSSGLSTVIKRKDKPEKTNWWKNLGS